MEKIVPARAILIPDDAICVFKGKIHDVYQWQQEQFDGSMATFEMLKRPDTVTALCIVDGKILVLQDDQPHRGLQLDFPGGRVDPADTSIVAATQREVLEETGYRFANWRLVKVWQPAPKIEWFIHQFLAWGVSEVGKPQRDAGERITVQQYALEDFSSEALGSLTDDCDVLKSVRTIDELLEYPQFVGKVVDR